MKYFRPNQYFGFRNLCHETVKLESIIKLFSGIIRCWICLVLHGLSQSDRNPNKLQRYLRMSVISFQKVRSVSEYPEYPKENKIPQNKWFQSKKNRNVKTKIRTKIRISSLFEQRSGKSPRLVGSRGVSPSQDQTLLGLISIECKQTLLFIVLLVKKRQSRNSWIWIWNFVQSIWKIARRRLGDGNY